MQGNFPTPWKKCRIYQNMIQIILGVGNSYPKVSQMGKSQNYDSLYSYYDPEYTINKQYNKQQESTMQATKDISELPFEQLFEMAEQKFNQLDYEQAEYYYELAYKKRPHDDMIVMCYAHVLKLNDKPQYAVELLLSSLKNNPNGNYKRYFQLAELESGQRSIQIFEQGIAAANKSLANPFLNTAPQTEIKRDIAQAYASIAQICMTDFANIPFEQVQAKCAQVLQKGRNMDPSCMDVHLQIANCCIEKDQYEAAKNSLLVIKQAILEEKQQYEDELVTQCAKYFMEIKQYQDSIDVLEKLHESQTNNPQTVYLMAYCAFQMGQYTLCKDYVQELEEHPQKQMIDQEVGEALAQLKQELNKKIKKGGEQTQEGCGDQGEWMDVEEEQFNQEDD